MKNERGMTLVEVLAALTILGIVFIGLMTVFPQMTLFNEKTNAKLETMNLAKQELVDLQQSPNSLFSKALSSEDGNHKVYVYPKADYQFEVTYTIAPELGEKLEESETNTSNNPKTLNKIEIIVKEEGTGRKISETFGYLKR